MTLFDWITARTAIIETQSERQSLKHQGAQRATGRTGRELAFHRTEQALGWRSALVDPFRERSSHLGAYSAHALGFHSASGRDRALHSELLPNIDVMLFAVEFGLGQQQTDTGLLGSRFDERGQIRAFLPPVASHDLRRQELVISVRHDHPLQSMSSRHRFYPR